jgi:membrane protein DedA with SNARE-associated domain
MEEFIIAALIFLKKLSYFGVTLALMFECVPAELILPLAGFWVFEGEMNFWLVVLAGTIGGTLGPLMLYFIGRYGGRPFVLKYGKYVFIREKQLNHAETFFNYHGAGVAFFTRFIPGIRTIIPIPCGIAKMNVFLFGLYTFLAMLPISYIYVFLGLRFGPKWRDVGPLAKDYLLEISLTSLVVLFLLISIKRTWLALKPSPRQK